MYNMLMNSKALNQCGNNDICQCDISHCDRPCANGLNSTNDYILIFGKNLRLTSISRACAGTLKDGVSLEQLIGKDFFFMAPDMEEVGTHSYFENALPGDIYDSDDYALKAPVNKDSIYSEMKVIKFEMQTIIVAKDITKQKQILNINKIQEQNLKELMQEQRDLKTTIDVIMNAVNEKQNELERNYRRNIEEMVLPMLDILRASSLDEHQKATIDILESNLQTITDSFSYVMTDRYGLTQRENEVANLIRLGKTTKQISGTLHLSCKTVDYHRMNIRKKLDIRNTGTNLRSQLLAFSDSKPSLLLH